MLAVKVRAHEPRRLFLGNNGSTGLALRNLASVSHCAGSDAPSALGIVGLSQRASTSRGISHLAPRPVDQRICVSDMGRSKIRCQRAFRFLRRTGLVARFWSGSSAVLFLLVGLRASSSSSSVVVTRPGTLRRYGVLVSSEGTNGGAGCRHHALFQRVWLRSLSADVCRRLRRFMMLRGPMPRCASAKRCLRRRSA
jgi:hypothetical protein